MLKAIIAQHYFKKEKNEEGIEDFKGYVGMSKFFTEYTQKLYTTLNKFMLKSKENIDLTNKKELLINEMYLEFVSTKNELNQVDDVVSIEQLLQNDELLLNLERIEVKMISELKPEFASEESKKIILMFQISARKDFSKLLKEKKDIWIEFEELKEGDTSEQ